MKTINQASRNISKAVCKKLARSTAARVCPPKPLFVGKQILIPFFLLVFPFLRNKVILRGDLRTRQSLEVYVMMLGLSSRAFQRTYPLLRGLFFNYFEKKERINVCENTRFSYFGQICGQ